VVQATRIDETTLLDKDKLDAELNDKLVPYLEAHAPEVLPQLKVLRKDDPEHQAKKLIFRTEVNGSPKETVLDHAFLAGPEYKELLTLRKSFEPAGPPPYAVKFDGEDEIVTGTLQEMLAAVRNLVTKGISIQRYKGLGEMNPEQLWETTMNPATRTLLQVKVGDAVESEEILSLLMGEAVEPRREFIEKNALDVSNLDI
jgi:DNA gyrase subunit B